MEQDTTIPTGLQSLLVELDFLSQIQRGKKPLLDFMVLVENDEWLKRFQKWWHGENKDTIMSKIENIVNRTVDAIVDHKNTAYIGILVNKLSDAKEGIASLLVTYGSFPKTIARINVQLQNIDLQLERYRHLIKGYKPGSDKEDKDEEKPDEKESQSDLIGSSERRRIKKALIKRSIDKQS